MNQATPSVRDLAQLLLALEENPTGPGGQSESQANVAWRVLEKLRLHLSRLVGSAGFQALLARALALAKTEASWLQNVRVCDDATLEGFNEAAQQQPAEAVAKGSTALIAQLLGLLITFIGQPITMHLLQEIWTAARMDDTNFGVKERRS